LAFVPFPLPELRLQIAQETSGWRLTFPKAMNLTVKYQEAIGSTDWTTLTNSFEDKDLNFSVLDPANSASRIYQLIAP
jgi:hypothetical protein